MAFNASADSSRAALRISQETVVGVTDASPVFKEIEITSESLTNERTTTTSQSFRGDRQVPGAIRTGETSSGSFGIEVKFGGVIDDIIAATLQGDWAANKVSNGVTRKSFTVEKEFTDLTSGDKVQAFKGAEFTSMSVSIAPGALVTAEFGIMARSSVDAAASLATSVVAAPTTKFFNGVTEGMDLTVDGSVYTNGIQSLSFELQNNPREQRQIGSSALAGVGFGRSNLTGSITAYFAGINPLNTAYKNDAPVELKFNLIDVDGNKYIVTLHNCVLTSRRIVAGGLDQDVVMEVAFQAIMGETGDFKTITIERDAA